MRLPDGTCIKIGRERFEAAEILFNPYIGGYDYPGVSEMVFNSINVNLIENNFFFLTIY